MGPTLIRNNMLTSAAIGSTNRAMSGVGERASNQDAVTGVSGVLSAAGNQVASAYGQSNNGYNPRPVPNVTLSNMSNSALVNSGNAAILGHGNLGQVAMNMNMTNQRREESNLNAGRGTNAGSGTGTGPNRNIGHSTSSR